MIQLFVRVVDAPFDLVEYAADDPDVPFGHRGAVEDSPDRDHHPFGVLVMDEADLDERLLQVFEHVLQVLGACQLPLRGSGLDDSSVESV